MDSLPSIASFAVPAALLAGLLLWAMRRWQRGGRGGQADESRDNVDTVVGWPPEAGRVLTIDERQAYDVLRRAFPTHLVLAQVPLSRFVRVPLRRSYSEWLQRVGSLSADLLLCDAGSRVVAVIDIRSAIESERARRRHERMARVLRQAGVPVMAWREGGLPDMSEARAMLLPVLQPGGTGPKGSGSRPMPLIPVADMEELPDDDRGFAATVYGPREHELASEPVSSDYFDDFEALPVKR